MSACAGKDAHPMDAVIAKAEALIEAQAQELGRALHRALLAETALAEALRRLGSGGADAADRS